MTDKPRLIEMAFPLKQTSIDAVHEKNVRQGHISTLHVWPARRPLAACRAALIATLLPDPNDDEARKKLVERLGGRVVERERKKNGKTVKVEETEGGVLHWGRETSIDFSWFREQIREAYGGRAPRVLDPFSGGGAIPLEAMRLGCEVTAIDINPVAWFLLRCTLGYPQELDGKMFPLPAFALEMPEFLAEFRKGTATSTKGKPRRTAVPAEQTAMFAAPESQLAWHVRAWGHWVLQRARKDLSRYYPPVGGSPTVAYLWARTVRCKSCRATIPLIKTRWLCKKEDKRVILTVTPRPDRTGPDFSVSYPSAREAADRKIATGTMSRSGARCTCCPAIMTMEDIRLEGRAGHLGVIMTAVVVDGQSGREYRVPTLDEIEAAESASEALSAAFDQVPFGLPNEEMPANGLGFRVPLYGFDRWGEIFTPRQLLALGTFVRHIRAARDAMLASGYPAEWVEAMQAYLAIALDRLADRSSTICRADPSPTQSGVIPTFARFALPMMWDFIEAVPIDGYSGGFLSGLEWVGLVLEKNRFLSEAPRPTILRESAATQKLRDFDVILTDPPYYDAIGYSDLMDFFYIWLRRTLYGLSPELDDIFASPLSPKWDNVASDGELIEDPGRFGGDATQARAAYENGMFRAFRAAHDALATNGRLVIVFAHKQPDAWETLVSAVIRAGFVVDGSWPIQTERGGRLRAFGSAALSSSVWLVCKKRPDSAKPGWDNLVLHDMRERIHARVRDFWDAGIRGPDFVWAATGPALEAYSKHPVVKKANEPGKTVGVGEFLRQVRRLVVDFVVGRVLRQDGDEDAASGLDDVTTYYLLHRHTFALRDAPAGACILYAVSCNLRDQELADQYDLLARSGAKKEAGDVDADDDEADNTETDEPTEGSGSKVRLKTWDQRGRKGMGYDAEGRRAPLIDQVHRLMYIWRTGDVAKVDDYLDVRALRKSQIFHQLLQAIIELAQEGSDERALLETISNHVSPRAQTMEKRQVALPLATKPIEDAP